MSDPKTLHDQIMNLQCRPYDCTTTYDAYCKGYREARHAAATIAAFAERDQPPPSAASSSQQGEADAKKLWLWKNFVDGRPEYWAFDNPFPINLDNDDPQTLGEPCGYAIFKPSRQGRTDVSEEQVLRRIASLESAKSGEVGK